MATLWYIYDKVVTHMRAHTQHHFYGNGYTVKLEFITCFIASTCRWRVCVRAIRLSAVMSCSLSRIERLWASFRIFSNVNAICLKCYHPKWKLRQRFNFITWIPGPLYTLVIWGLLLKARGIYNNVSENNRATFPEELLLGVEWPYAH